MKPIPVVFHLGPLQVHTYGIGLALTFWFAYNYYHRLLKKRGYPTTWLHNGFIWIVVSAVIGARIVHVVANASYYLHSPGQIPLIWHGGLSSFGGIGGGVLAGIYFLRKSEPPLSIPKATDTIAPALLASWSLGRLLGPQLMYAGGGRPTNSWFGMYYAGEVGKRIPVPLLQSIEDFLVFLIVTRLAKLYLNKGLPDGMTLASAIGLWSIERFADEYFWLAVPRLWDAVEVFAIILFLAALVATLLLLRKWRHNLASVAPEHASPSPIDEAPMYP